MQATQQMKPKGALNPKCRLNQPVMCAIIAKSNAVAAIRVLFVPKPISNASTHQPRGWAVHEVSKTKRLDNVFKKQLKVDRIEYHLPRQNRQAILRLQRRRNISRACPLVSTHTAPWSMSLWDSPQSVEPVTFELWKLVLTIPLTDHLLRHIISLLGAPRHILLRLSCSFWFDARCKSSIADGPDNVPSDGRIPTLQHQLFNPANDQPITQHRRTMWMYASPGN